jgi:hypothetical protein
METKRREVKNSYAGRENLTGHPPDKEVLS